MNRNSDEDGQMLNELDHFVSSKKRDSKVVASENEMVTISDNNKFTI